MTKSKAKPLPVFVSHLETVRAQLAQLQALADGHFGYLPEDVSWTAAGSVAHVSDLLAQALEHFGKKV